MCTGCRRLRQQRRGRDPAEASSEECPERGSGWTLGIALLFLPGDDLLAPWFSTFANDAQLSKHTEQVTSISQAAALSSVNQPSALTWHWAWANSRRLPSSCAGPTGAGGSILSRWLRIRSCVSSKAESATAMVSRIGPEHPTAKTFGAGCRPRRVEQLADVGLGVLAALLGDHEVLEVGGAAHLC